MVDVVGPVVRVVDPLPAEGQLVLLAVLGALLLDPGESGVQPVRGTCRQRLQCLTLNLRQDNRTEHHSDNPNYTAICHFQLVEALGRGLEVIKLDMGG